MQAKFEVLQQSRKGRSAPADLASVEALAGYGETAASPLHQTGKPGITALSVDPKDPSTVVTGGKDGQVPIAASALRFCGPVCYLLLLRTSFLSQ